PDGLLLQVHHDDDLSGFCHGSRPSRDAPDSEETGLRHARKFLRYTQKYAPAETMKPYWSVLTAYASHSTCAPRPTAHPQGLFLPASHRPKTPTAVSTQLHHCNATPRPVAAPFHAPKIGRAPCRERD